MPYLCFQLEFIYYLPWLSTAHIHHTVNQLYASVSVYVWKCIFGLLQFLTCTKKVCFVLYEEGWVSVLLTLSTKITQCQVVSKLLQANNTRIQTFLYSDQDKNGFAAGALKFNMWLHAHYRCSYSLWWWSRSWCISQSWQFSVPRWHFMVTYHLKGTAMDTGIIIF